MTAEPGVAKLAPAHLGAAYDHLIMVLDAAGARYRVIDHAPEGRTERVSALRGYRSAARCLVVMGNVGRRRAFIARRLRARLSMRRRLGSPLTRSARTHRRNDASYAEGSSGRASALVSDAAIVSAQRKPASPAVFPLRSRRGEALLETGTTTGSIVLKI